jgi:hypothetical protein
MMLHNVSCPRDLRQNISESAFFKMLVLSKLHNLLSQILSLPHLHTAVLLTPEGQLVSVACDPYRPKDEIRVVVGLCGEVWQETRAQGFGMVDSEVMQSNLACPYLAEVNCC